LRWDHKRRESGKEQAMRGVLNIAAVLVAGAVLVTGCGAITGCKEDTQTVDVEWGSAFYDAQLSILRAWEGRGYDCRGSAIRNAFGRQIGTTYTCTKCD
jgi:hypothetical protein